MYCLGVLFCGRFLLAGFWVLGVGIGRVFGRVVVRSGLGLGVLGGLVGLCLVIWLVVVLRLGVCF